ncbi:uncharacterized protein LOC115319928 [Ixodes scapularis]|uniref:uncharacterized protein LOC115319928 n=1 Tax=Ixodes scapularis TaxID=6945 RepID=UPI001A9DF422|nr:uncharacterized protein LOC115319928 [Ixodes scapularis]
MSQEESVDSKFFVGSIVWAKLDSYPWWPAMIDDDPDSCLYVCNKDPYDEDRVVNLPFLFYSVSWEWPVPRIFDSTSTHYHVTFLDKNVTRAWVREDRCMPFCQEGVPGNKVVKKYKKAFNDAVERAKLAVKLSLPERIAEYCFINNYPPLRSASLRRTQTKSKQPRKKSTKCKTTTQPLTSDMQTAKRPRGKPPKVGTTTQETRQTQSGSAATSSLGQASRPAFKGAKERIAASKSDQTPKYQSATETIKKMQKRKDVGAYQNTMQCQEQTKSAAGATNIIQQLPQLAAAAVLQNLPSAQPQIQEEAAITVPVPNKALNPNPVHCLSAIQANCSPNEDQQPKMHIEAEKQGPVSPIQASQVKVQVDTLPLLQRFGAASEQSRVLAQLKPATKASATKLPNGTPVLSETLLSITGGQTQESLEGIGNINSLIQFLGNDVEKDGRSDDGTCLADAKTEIVPASDATASGELLSQLMPKESTTASVPPFGAASRSEQRNTITSSGMQSGADLVPEVAPMKQVKQGVPKFFKEKTAFKGDKSKTLSKAKKEINGKPKKLKKPGAKEPAADVVAQLLNDAAALAKQAKGPAERAGKALASARPTVTPARTLNNITAEVPAKPATAPASGSFTAATVLLPKPVAMVPTVAVQLKEVAALEKPAAKTGSVQKTVTGMQATHRAPHQKRLFKVPTKETATTPPEAFASPKEMPITRANCDKDQLTSSGSWTTLEDSDFDALSNTTSLTFDNDLSSASQDIETDCDTDFVSLETVDCSQAFAMQE